MTITETTNAAVINWGSFNIGAKASVAFVQPSSTSVLLNRVLSADPTRIYGSLTANGEVFIVNAQGVLFAPGAQVDVGGLVASSLGISDKDFLSGNWSFSGTNPASVSNAGDIHIENGGFAALLGGHASNSGTIAARMGSVALASGNRITLDLDASGLIKVGISQAAVDSLVQNSGAIIADGGRIVLTAKAADAALATVVNNDGLLQARHLGVRDGQVWLLAADEIANTGATGPAANAAAVQNAAGGVESSGSIDVSGGGEASLAGTRVLLSGDINASGGNSHVLLNSTQETQLAAGSAIDLASSAARNSLVVWSQGQTDAAGSVDGRGLGSTGAGATVEISAGHTLQENESVLLGAASPAAAGTLILDPATLEIAAGSGSATANIVYQNALQNQSGNIVLAATGQITVDALANNALNLANATSLSITSSSSGGINFLNGILGAPSTIITHGAPVTLNASGSGALSNVASIVTNGGNIDLSGVFVHLAGGLDATNGGSPAGNVAVTVFGGGILSSSTSPLAGARVLLDGTFGYVGDAAQPIPTSTGDLVVKTGGNAYVSNAGPVQTVDLTSNHLEGTPVGIAISASNLLLTGADAIGDGTLYSPAVHWTQYNASNPSVSVAGPTSVSLTEDGNLLPANIDLPQTTVSLRANQGFILGGNTQPVIASTLLLSSPLGIGGADLNGVDAETDSNNTGAPGGATLLTEAGTVNAAVLSPAGNIVGIANITAQGDLLGSVHASGALLQASGDIGSALAPLDLNLGNNGTAFNIAAGANVNIDATFFQSGTFVDANAGGSLSIQTTDTAGYGGSGATYDNVLASSDVQLTGIQNNDVLVHAATSTNGSINIINDNLVYVESATLGGTDAVSRSIALTSNYGTVIYGALSTNGPADSAAAAAPVGSIAISAPQGYIGDINYWNNVGTAVLRAGTITMSSYQGIYLYNTQLDTYANVSLTTGAQYVNGSINANFTGIDSVNDPAGAAPHSIHLGNVSTDYGSVSITDTNGDIRVGTIAAFYDYGGGDIYGSSITMTTPGSIVPDGQSGGGRIDSNDGSYGGYITLSAGASLGQRGTGPGGTTGAGYLSLSGNTLALTTNGDLFALNDQDGLSVQLNLNYLNSTVPFYYHFLSGTASEIQANAPALALDGQSSGGLLTITNGAIGENTFTLTTDGDQRIEAFQADAYSYLNFVGRNISVDPLTNTTPAFTIGGGTNIQFNASGSLDIGSLATNTQSPTTTSTVALNANGGDLTLGNLALPNGNVTVIANGGDILGAVGNSVQAATLGISNAFGAIGADPTVAGSVPILLGVSGALTLTNSAGGSINLATLNDPASLILNFYAPNGTNVTSANYAMVPTTTGLGFTGHGTPAGITLDTLGTTGSNPAAVPISITSYSPSITIDSGATGQLGVGYQLGFSGSYQSVVANLAGSSGQTVVVHTDNTLVNGISGVLGLTNLELDANTYSNYAPLAVSWALNQPLSVFTLVRGGNAGDANAAAAFGGNSVVLSGSGQTISDVESAGTGQGGTPGTMLLDAQSTTALALKVHLNEDGILSVGNIGLTPQSTVTLGVNSQTSGFYANFSGAIVGSNSSNSITAGSVTLTASAPYANSASLGIASAPVNIDAANVVLTSSGNIYANTSSALDSLSITALHPAWQAAGGSYVYQVGGSAGLQAADANTTAPSTNLTSLAPTGPLNFSFTSDANLLVGALNVGSGSLTLASNGSFTGSNNFTPIGIDALNGGSITAGSVTLDSTGYLGHVGGINGSLALTTPNLTISSDGNVAVADSTALTALSLSVGHSRNLQNNVAANNTYSITAPQLTMSMVDNNNNAFCCNTSVQILELVSSSLQTFTFRTTDTAMAVGNLNGATGDFTNGQLRLGPNATVNLFSYGDIFAVPYTWISPIQDVTTSAYPSTAAAIVTGTLNLTANGGIESEAGPAYWGEAAYSLPISVTNLSMTSGTGAYITSFGNLNVVSASVGGEAYIRAVGVAPGTAASISGGSASAPVTAQSMTLVTQMGTIGPGGTPLTVDTSTLTVQSGADINVADTSGITHLTIVSNHNKGSINDTSNGGLNSISITDTSPGAPFALGATDLGAANGGYQITGMSAPEMQSLSFQTDTSISVGSIQVGTTANPGTVTLTAQGGSILQIANDTGAVTAGSVTLAASPQGRSIGSTTTAVRVDSPNLTLTSGGNLNVADSADISSYTVNLGAVTDLGSLPTYALDNSAAPHPLAFGTTVDLAHNAIDITQIAVSRTDAPVSISLSIPGSSIGVGTITSDNGTVSLYTQSGNIFGLGQGTGINGSTVNLNSQYGNIGDGPGGVSASVPVTATTLSATTNGDLRITTAPGLTSATLGQNAGAMSASGVWSLSGPGFNLQGVGTNTGALDITSATGSATNLTVNSQSDLKLGTLSLGTGNLGISVGNGGAINSDTTNGSTPNITTSGTTSLSGYSGIGNLQLVTTNVAGAMSLGVLYGPVDVDQTASTPLTINGLSAGWWYGSSPINLTAASSITFTSSANGGAGSTSPMNVTAGGNIDFHGYNFSVNGGPLTVNAGGNIIGGDVFNVTSVSMAAAGTATGSTGSVSLGNVTCPACPYGVTAATVSVQGAGDITLNGTISAVTSVSVTSTGGGIYGQSSDVFETTPTVNLSAYTNIGSGSASALGAMSLNTYYLQNPENPNVASPGPLHLSAQAGGAIDVLSYVATNATSLSAGGNISLQVLGDPYLPQDTPLNFGTVSSTGGNVSLSTYQGNIAGINGASTITAGGTINLAAGQNPLYYLTGTGNTTIYGLGSASAPLRLSGAQIDLTANGNIYATVPTTGVSGIAVGRNYVNVPSNPGLEALLMPAGLIQITDTSSNPVVVVNDGGWSAGGLSAVSANYASALSLSVTANNAIQLGAISLSGGNLSLQETNPFNLAITSNGGLVQASNLSFSLTDPVGTASGGFGSASQPINTQILSLSGTTVGPGAGVFMNQIGPIALTSLVTGGDIVVTTTRASGAPSANANIAVGTVQSNGGSVTLTADGAIDAANGVSNPSIIAAGPGSDGNVTLQAAAGVNLPGATLQSNNGTLTVGATAGGIVLSDGTLAAAGAVDVQAGAGSIGMSSSHVTSSYANITIDAAAGGADLTAAAIQANGGSVQVALTAGQGDLTIGAIQTTGSVDLNAPAGNIFATPASQNLTGLENGISTYGGATLVADGAIGRAAAPLVIDSPTGSLTVNATTTNGDMNLVLGSAANAFGSATLDATAGGAMAIANYFPTITLDNVQSQGDLIFTQQNFYAQIMLNTVGAVGPGAMLEITAPYANISSVGPGSVTTASRLVLNALGDSSGGAIGYTGQPVNVDAGVTLAVASGDINLDSVSTAPTKMPLVASNGLAPTVTITSAGDFLVGQVVGGQQGTVNITSATNIYDDQDPNTQVHGATVNLLATGNIGTAGDPVATAAVSYDTSGNPLPGTISAVSSNHGSLYLDQQGDALLQTLTAANGSISATIHDAPQGQSTLAYADTSATDAAGNDITITLTQGDLLVETATAGLTAGTVSLTASGGSLYGDGRSDCCTNPNVSGNQVNLTAAQNIGTVTSVANLTGTPIGIEDNFSSITAPSATAQVNLLYVGNVTIGPNFNAINAAGASAQVLIQACGNLTIESLDVGAASLGVVAGVGVASGATSTGTITNGNPGGGAPNITAGSLVLSAPGDIGTVGTPLTLDTPSISGSGGGAMYLANQAPGTTTVNSLTTNGAPISITTQGDIDVGSINAGNASVALNSTAGAIVDIVPGGSNDGNPNIVGGAVSVNAANGVGTSGDPLTISAASISGGSSGGGVYINSASPDPTTISSLVTGGGPISLNGVGDLDVQSINAGTGSVALASSAGSIDNGGGNGGGANIVGGNVSVQVATGAGTAGSPLVVDASTLSGTAAAGGLYLQSISPTTTTIASLSTAGGPINLSGVGGFGVQSIDAGSGSVNLSSSAGAIADATSGGSSLASPNIVGGNVTVSAATSVGTGADPLVIDAATIGGGAGSGGFTVASASTDPVTISSIVTTGSGPVSLVSQGDMAIGSINAGNGSVALNSVGGAIGDGISGGSSLGQPNIVAGTATVTSVSNVGSAADPLVIDAATIGGATGSGGFFAASGNTTPVTISGISTSGSGPIALQTQGTMNVQSIDAGNGSVSLASQNGSILGGAGASLANPSIIAGNLTLDAGAGVGTGQDSLVVDAQSIAGSAGHGGFNLDSAATAPVTIGPIDTTHGGAIDISAQGDMDLQTVNARTGNVTLTSVGGTVAAVPGGAGAGQANVAGTNVHINAATGIGASGQALAIKAQTLDANAHGGIWLNSIGTAPLMVDSVKSHGGTVNIATVGTMNLMHIDAGSGNVTLKSTTGAILDAIPGGASPGNPNVIAALTSFSAPAITGLSTDSLWVSGKFKSTAPSSYINYVPLSPYPYLPLTIQAIPQTVYSAYAAATRSIPQTLPITTVGAPMSTASPIQLDAERLGIALPRSAIDNAWDEDNIFGFDSVDVKGGNAPEIGRKKPKPRDARLHASADTSASPIAGAQATTGSH
jgi:filamentous hemagglutinin family protein